MTLELKRYKKRIMDLELILEKTNNKIFMGSLEKIVRETLFLGAIKNFEWTYDASRKYMKRWLELNMGSEYVDGVTRRELFRLARESHLIESVEKWMDYHFARNNTSHTYNEETAEEVYEITNLFIDDAKKLYSVFEKKVNS